MFSLAYEYQLPAEIIRTIFDYKDVLVPCISKYFHGLWLRKIITDSTRIFPRVISFNFGTPLPIPDVNPQYLRAMWHSVMGTNRVSR